MIPNVLYIIVALLIDRGNAQLTQLCIKHDEFLTKNTSKPIPGDFSSLILRTNVHIDRSMLVRRVMETEEGSVLVITCPCGWGKSINLNMLKYFFEVRLTPNDTIVPPSQTPSYKYFSEGIITNGETIHKLKQKPKISQYREFIDQHLAKYPIIFLDFSSLAGKQATFGNVLLGFKIIMRQVFRAFLHVLTALQQKNEDDETVRDKVKQFTRYLKMKEDDWSKVAASMNFLTKVLNEHYNEKVIILSDDFDKAYRLVYLHKNLKFFNEDKLIVTKFFQHFMQKTYEENEEIIKLVVLTGQLPITTGSDAPHYHHRHVLNMKNLHRLYGISEAELDEIVEYFEINDKKSQILEWYGGYCSLNETDKMLNPFSVTSLVAKNNSIQNYWIDDARDLFEFIFRLLKYDEFREIIEKLLANGTAQVPYHKITTISDPDLDILNKIMWNETKTISRDDITTVLSFCCVAGLLTTESNPSNDTEYHDNAVVALRIPNREVKSYISVNVQNYHKGAG